MTTDIEELISHWRDVLTDQREVLGSTAAWVVERTIAALEELKGLRE